MYSTHNYRVSSVFLINGECVYSWEWLEKSWKIVSSEWNAWGWLFGKSMIAGAEKEQNNQFYKITQPCAYRDHISLIKFRDWSRRNEKCFVGGKKSAFLVWGPSVTRLITSLRPQSCVHKSNNCIKRWDCRWCESAKCPDILLNSYKRIVSGSNNPTRVYWRYLLKLFVRGVREDMWNIPS